MGDMFVGAARGCGKGGRCGLTGLKRWLTAFGLVAVEDR
jgi:hypothetical protein